MAITQQRLTLDEFLKLPEEEPALEFEEGVVTQKVAPKGRHSWLQYKLAEYFNHSADPQRLARAFPELRASFGGRSYVPDVAVYRWERIPWDAQGDVPDEFFAPPDIAIEIVSPGQSVNRLVRRCVWYVANGVRLALLVDPDDRSVIVFDAEGRTRALEGADRMDFGVVLPGLQLSVQELFSFLRGGGGD